MRDVLVRLRVDAGQLTLASLIQEREAAAHEIERLRRQVASTASVGAAPPSRQPKRTRATPIERSVELRTLHPITLLRLSDVCSLVRISRSTIYLRISDGSFPAPVRVGKRSVRWRGEDVDAWRRAHKN
jgi:prophage regulatory protein